NYTIDENHDLVGEKIFFDQYMTYVENLDEKKLLPVANEIKRELNSVSNSNIYTYNLFVDGNKDFKYVKKNMEFEVVQVVVVNPSLGGVETIVVLKDENDIQSTISLKAIQDNEVWNKSQYFAKLDSQYENLLENLDRKGELVVSVKLDEKDYTGSPIVFSQDTEIRKKQIRVMQDDFLDNVPEKYTMNNIVLNEESPSIKMVIDSDTLVYFITSEKDLKINTILEYLEPSSLY
ncbi:MAG: hypothetical protein KC550_00450, partial [Nanoarchaeota archaeon]|nr:hypothetical protein [Nanoarchaeota archaeon]